MIHVPINYHLNPMKSGGEFRLLTRNPDGSIGQDTGWFSNLLDRFVAGKLVLERAAPFVLRPLFKIGLNLLIRRQIRPDLDQRLDRLFGSPDRVLFVVANGIEFQGRFKSVDG